MAEQVNWQDEYEPITSDGETVETVFYWNGAPRAYIARDKLSHRPIVHDTIYRLNTKPKPKSYRPFKRGEVLCGAKFVSKINGAEYLVLQITDDAVWFNVGKISYQQLLSDYTRLDGSPAGILE